MAKYLGLDIGSISINTVVLDEDLNVLEERYDYCHGRPFHVLRDVLGEITASIEVAGVAATGSGGQLATELIGGHFVNEIVAQSSSVAILLPHVRSVIEMGGEDSKLLYMTPAENGSSRLHDFAMNSICAAGTGSFLDQQARRIGVSIENEFGELALQSENPPRIAGRCSVFAKSDMIHLQQIATPVHDIVAGLCFAVARNFKSNLARGRSIVPPVAFQGGVAANAGMVRAFREVLGMSEEELFVPARHASMGAIGAVYHLLTQNGSTDARFLGLEALEHYLGHGATEEESLEPLSFDTTPVVHPVKELPESTRDYEVYLGIDVGSLSTNVVLIDADNNVIARRYLRTASRPLDAIRRGLSEIEAEVGARVRVRGVGTTGSGRYLTGDFIGADTIQNEITAQATAAVAIDPTVDTIFEIGGQDSKFISLDDGVVVDFEMNKVCAAGTGSFLEEQAEKLDINIVEQFSECALASEHPSKLGDRCTVFMESDLNAHQQKGARRDDLVAGLAYSIVYNYLQKVVGNKRVGERIFFQGGVTNNKSVVAAFEKVTGKPIAVPPHFDVTGAIGAAILARNTVADGRPTRFKGFDVSRTKFTVDRFTCHACSNECEIRRIRIDGERRPLFYGGRCERYEVAERKNRGQDIPNLFVERERILLDGYEEAEASLQELVDDHGGNGGNGSNGSNGNGSNGNGHKRVDTRPTVGIPRALMVYWQQFPLWRRFFEELGFRVVLSKESDRTLVTKSLGMLTAETCFPVSVAYGHVADLIEREVDWVFMPFIANSAAGDDNPTVNYNCPWVQTYPFMIRAALRSTAAEEKLLIPAMHLRYGERVAVDELADYLTGRFSCSKKDIQRAFRRALDAQKEFERRIEARGREVMDSLPADKVAAVVLGLPYNTGDPELNLSLVEKLINLGVVPIPIDFLPLEKHSVFDSYPMMYWPNGRRILEASRIAANDDNLAAIYMGNFRCGPDSFLLHYVREEMAGKPFLQLEVDEHSADAGMITRCEAFLESLRGYNKVKSEAARAAAAGRIRETNRVLYFPYMSDGAYALAAAARSCGVESDVLPQQDARDLELGRRYTSSRECFPMICTTGSFIKKMLEPGFEPERTSFFMPDHNGPCRFGQYRKLQRIIFDRLGFTNVDIVSPSNSNAYVELSGGHPLKFRLRAWRGMVAVDMLRRLLSETRPYERSPGAARAVYQESLDELVRVIESGGRNYRRILLQAVERFREVRNLDIPRKPIVAIVGEIFMRDNPFCNGYIERRLEALGVETVTSPVYEWLSYSAYRFARDSKWQRDPIGLLRAKLLETVQNMTARPLLTVGSDYLDERLDLHLHDILESCEPYVHHHYDGDPPLALGTAVTLARRGISGVANILPFTCQPGTLITAVAGGLRQDHGNLPWVDIAYDGQDDAALETRLQAFVYQTHEFQHAGNGAVTHAEPRETVGVE
jgi:predicted CoA-substrate-specific enzyme activase